MKRRSKSISWMAAAEWIAQNDNPEDTTYDDIVGTVTVAMVSDLTGVSQEQIARRIKTLRELWQEMRSAPIQHISR